jgi:chemotaxis protein methyltransferase WspC
MGSKSLDQIIGLLEAKLGLKSNSTSLILWEDVVKERMAYCNLITYTDYFKRLLLSSDELQELIERIMIRETWFFRDKETFDFLFHWVKKVNIQIPLLKILSLGCSTGEEPYSIVMTLFEAGISRNSFIIDAMDISQTALIKARLGVYRKNSFRNKDLSYRDRYFDKTSIGYIIKDMVKEQVHFCYGNILDDQTSFDFPSYDLIFCRHVLIYLDHNAQMKVLNRIKTLLAPQGILIVGSAEKKIALKAGFISDELTSTYAFRINQHLQNVSQRNKPSFDENQITQTKNPSSTLPKLDLLQDQLFHSSFKEEELKFNLLQEAIKFADEGAFEASMQVCFNFISTYGATSDIFFLLGLINQAMGNDEKAEDFFLKTVYLKPSHYEALVCLALVNERKGDFKKAEIFRERARKNV